MFTGISKNTSQYLLSGLVTFAITMGIGFGVQTLKNISTPEKPNSHPIPLLILSTFSALIVSSIMPKAMEMNRKEKRAFIDLCIKALKETNQYPPEYLGLIRRITDPEYVVFVNPSYFPEGQYQYGACDGKTFYIGKPVKGKNQDFVAYPQALLHELTHSLKPDSSKPDSSIDEKSYLEWMRAMLCEEVVAESSVFYGLSKALLDPNRKKPLYLNHLCIPKNLAISNDLHKNIKEISSQQGLPKEEKEILLESLVFLYLMDSAFKSPRWIESYTQYFNAENGTNHDPNQYFEPPLLPLTLARAVQDVFKNNSKIAVVWHTMTGIDSQTLSLAAQQAQWPRFKSDIEPVAALSQQGRFDR
jgi:hypothetical protein